MFGKIFSSMFTGSMVGTGAVTFAVWSYVIANMEPGDDGKMWVELNPSLLAGILGEPVEEVAEVVEKFCQPDANSRSKEEGGRKLVRQGQFLFWVVNGAEYRLARNKEARREYQRKWMADRRAELAARGVPQVKRPRKGKGKPLPGEAAAVAAAERGDQNGADAITAAALPETVPHGTFHPPRSGPESLPPPDRTGHQSPSRPSLSSAPLPASSAADSRGPDQGLPGSSSTAPEEEEPLGPDGLPLD